MPSASYTDTLKRLVKASRTELDRSGLGKSKGHAYGCQSINVKRWNGKGYGAEFFEPGPCSDQCRILRAVLDAAEQEINERK